MLIWSDNTERGFPPKNTRANIKHNHNSAVLHYLHKWVKNWYLSQVKIKRPEECFDICHSFKLLASWKAIISTSFKNTAYFKFPWQVTLEFVFQTKSNILSTKILIECWEISVFMNRNPCSRKSVITDSVGCEKYRFFQIVLRNPSQKSWNTALIYQGEIAWHCSVYMCALKAKSKLLKKKTTTNILLTQSSKNHGPKICNVLPFTECRHPSTNTLLQH